MAASRSVVARLAIDGVQGVVTGFKKAREAAIEYGRVSQSNWTTASQYVKKHADQLDSIGTKLTAVGVIGVASMAGLAKVAMDWESAWAGVTKTVDGTPEQMGALEESLRSMARTLPASHQEIAAVAEAAGQLGVRVEDVAAFTRTMIDLGETTNMTADEAATTLQRFMNVMGTSSSDVDELGSTIVGLGNSFATTEAEIAAMAQRVAGVGRQMGMSEADVLGFAAAMSSVGIEAEAGGTAISTTMKRIDSDVRDGGEALEKWAKLAGQSAEDFSSAWREDAAEAMASVVEGLGGVVASGESAAKVLEDLGVSGIREADTMNRLALATEAAGSGTDLLREALELSNTAWEDNVALQNEAAKRYETREAQVRMAINSIKDEAITLGQYLLPALDSILRAVTGAAEAFGSLPTGTQEALVGLGAVVTVSTLAAGGLLKAVVAASNLRTALTALGISARTATVAMGAVGIALTAAGAILGAWMGRQAEATERAREYTDVIRQQGAVISESTKQMAAQHLEDAGLLKWAEEAGVSLSDLTEAALGSKEAMSRVDATLDSYVESMEASVAANQAEIDALTTKGSLTYDEQVRLTELINTNDTLNASISERVGLNQDIRYALGEEAKLVSESAEAGLRMAEAVGSSSDATSEAAAAADEHARVQQEVAQAYAESKAEIDALIEATFAYANALLTTSGNEIAVEESIRRLNEQVANGKTGLDLTTEAGIANQKALNDLARSTITYTENLAKNGATTEEIADKTKRAREAWEEAAESMGMSTEEIERLAEAYFAIPDEVGTTVNTNAPEVKEKIDELNRRIAALPEEQQTEVRALIDSGSFGAAERRLDELSSDRSMTISARIKMMDGPGATRLPLVPQADGSVLDYYATGGIRERHVAQIAPAGAWRVWAEPETGGEAYIPLSPAKRSRSLEIWRETGRRLGVQGYRDGGLVAQLRPTEPRGSSPVEFNFTANGVGPREVAREARDVFSHEMRAIGRVRA